MEIKNYKGDIYTGDRKFFLESWGNGKDSQFNRECAPKIKGEYAFVVINALNKIMGNLKEKKILEVADEHFDVYGDWLLEPANTQFIEGNYTHTQDEDGCINEASVVKFNDGTSGVCIGEQINEL